VGLRLKPRYLGFSGIQRTDEEAHLCLRCGLEPISLSSQAADFGVSLLNLPLVLLL
jgi:hypothetical protein